MLKFTYKAKIHERVAAKCARHPRYNPEKDGRGGIRGACHTCYQLYDLYKARVALDEALRHFIRMAAPWASYRARRAKASSDAKAASQQPSQSEAPGSTPDQELDEAAHP